MINGYDLKDWLAIALSCTALGTVLVGWFRFGGNKAMEALDAHKGKNNIEIKSLDERLDRHGERLLAIENDIRHMPDKDEITGLKLQIEKLNGEIGKLTQGFSTMQKTVDRIDTYLTKRQG